MTPQEEAEKLYPFTPPKDVEDDINRNAVNCRHAFMQGDQFGYNRAKREFEDSSKCEDCDGEGGHENYNGGTQRDWQPCKSCNGAGEIKSKLSEYESKIKELEEALKGFTGQWLADKDKIKELESLLADKEERYKNHDSVFIERIKEIDSLQKERDELIAKVKDLEEQVESEYQANLELGKDCRRLCDELHEAKKECDQLKEIISGVR